MNYQILSIDITNIQYKLFNFFIQDLIYQDSQIIFSTALGDLVKISGDFSESCEKRDIQSQKYNFINKIQGNMRCMALLESSERVIYASGEASIVYAYSLDDHEIIGKAFKRRLDGGQPRLRDRLSAPRGGRHRLRARLPEWQDLSPHRLGRVPQVLRRREGNPGYQVFAGRAVFGGGLDGPNYLYFLDQWLELFPHAAEVDLFG